MTPPKAKGTGSNAQTPMLSAVSVIATPQRPIPEGLSVLQIRADFLRAAQAKRHAAGGFLLQARPRGDASPGIRVGFTASKKIGNAVLRNRAKRRLREIARALLSEHGLPGWDYVLVARPVVTVTRDFAGLLEDMTNALRILHKTVAK